MQNPLVRDGEAASIKLTSADKTLSWYLKKYKWSFNSWEGIFQASLQELKKFLTLILGHISENGSLARYYHFASSSSHSDSADCTQIVYREIQRSLLHCNCFITCSSSSVLPIWHDCQFIFSLILKSRCTASKPPGLSHMRMPSDLLLFHNDQVT